MKKPKIYEDDDEGVKDGGFWMFDDKNSESDMENADEDPFALETIDERRVRLAKEFLDRIKQVEGGSDDEDAIESKLKDSLNEAKGTLQKTVADDIKFAPSTDVFLKGPHRKAVTSIACHGQTIVSASKDSIIVKWDVHTGQRLFTIPRGGLSHEHPIFSTAISPDGNLGATGDSKGNIRVWDLRNPNQSPNQSKFRRFKHSDAVSCLKFRQDQSLELISGSFDRSIKIWNIDSALYVDTLFGHYSGISSLSTLPGRADLALSSGQDNTLRLWKLSEESQLMFKGPGGSTVALDACSMLRPDTFISGGQDGNIALWSRRKKKPIRLCENAHGGKWISALTSLPFSDVSFSGSSDGMVRMWRCGESKNLDEMGSTEIKGFVNEIAVSSDLSFLASAVGREHKFGRWEVDHGARDGIHISKLEHA